MTDIYFQGIWRMDWALGNPNKTAALIAILVVAVWAFAYVRKWGFAVALVLFTGLGVCLIHTFSRGGLIAAAAGLGILVCYAPRPWPRPKMIAIGIATWIIIGFSVLVQAHERYGQGVASEDRSITNRISLWRNAPAMMVDAPGGWGIGQSGISYARWYQPVDRREPYRTFVNSHLTWLVELGWSGRFLYLAGWAFVLAACWPTAKLRALAIPLGVWVSFAVSATFSSVAESPWLWLVPAVSLVWAVSYRVRRRAEPTWPQLFLPPALAASACLTLYVLGSLSDSPVKRKGEMVVYGRGEPKCLVLADVGALGTDYQRVLRKCSVSGSVPTVGVVESASAIPVGGKTKLILTGNLSAVSSDTMKALLRNADEILFVNPKMLPQEAGLSELGDNRVKAAYGEFAQSPAFPAWSRVATVTRLPGVGDFIPDWPVTLLKPLPNE